MMNFSPTYSHRFAISEYMKYVKPDLLFFRALCYHWWCFMYFYLASKKIYSSGLPLPARHYHTNQRWRLPQLPRSDSQLPKTLWCYSWYWAFSQQWRQPRNWGFWKVLPRVQWWNTPVLSYQYHTRNPQFLHRQQIGWGPLGEKVWRDCSAVGCWANFLFSFSASPCQALLWEKGCSDLDSHIQVFSPLSLFEGQWTGSQSLLWNSWYLGILLGISPSLNVLFFFFKSLSSRILNVSLSAMWKDSQGVWLDYKIYHWSKGKTFESPFADYLPQFARGQTQKTTLLPHSLW